jgi:hypothetical protein
MSFTVGPLGLCSSLSSSRLCCTRWHPLFTTQLTLAVPLSFCASVQCSNLHHHPHIHTSAINNTSIAKHCYSTAIETTAPLPLPPCATKSNTTIRLLQVRSLLELIMHKVTILACSFGRGGGGVVLNPSLSVVVFRPYFSCGLPCLINHRQLCTPTWFSPSRSHLMPCLPGLPILFAPVSDAPASLCQLGMTEWLLVRRKADSNNIIQSIHYITL